MKVDSVSPRRSFRVVQASFLTSIAAALAGVSSFGYYSIFCAFSFWDDEGFLMLSYKMFNEGRALYDEVFTVYGPFVYLYHFVAYLGQPVDHNLTRLLTLAHWILIALGCALLVQRLCGSRILSLIVLLESAVILKALIHEPGHPQGLCLLLIVIALHFSIGSHRSSRSIWRAFLFGVIIALLVLSKINLGIYLAIAATLVVLLGHQEKRWIAFLARIAAVCSILLPFLLMRQQLFEHWVTSYAMTVSFALAALVVAAIGARLPIEFSMREGLMTAGGFGCAAVAVILFIMQLGTSFGSLVFGSVLRLLTFSTVFDHPASFGWGSVVAALISFVLALLYVLAKRRPGAECYSNRVHQALLGIRIVMLAGLVFSIHGKPEVMLGYFAPFSWLILVRNSSSSWLAAAARPRIFLAASAVLMMLWGYPVFGSQSSWSAFLVLPTVAVVGWDAVGYRVTAFFSRTVNVSRSYVSTLAMVALLFLYFGPGPLSITQARSVWEARRPLPFAGSEKLRPPASIRALLIGLIPAIHKADCLITLPGLGSLYFWAGLAPPTGFNTTTWMVLLSDSEQETIIEKCSEFNDVVVVYSPMITQFWVQGRDVGERPLVRHISENFHTTEKFGEYLVLRQNRRKVQ